MSSKIRIGLIGYGYWGPNYARVFSETPDSMVTAICDGQPERLARAAARFPEVAVCGDAGELLARKDVDAVVVSTPATTHFELARRALASGRHVLVEKPLATEVEHCEQLAELAEQQERVLMVAHTFLYNAGIRKVHECVKSGAFGHVHYLHSTRTNLGPIRHDVNAIWDLAPHDISIFNYLLGQQPSWASAIGSRVLMNNREDVGFITLGYPDRVLANIHVSWADPNKVREVVVVGSRQRIVFNDMDDLERVRIFEKGVSVGEQDAESFGEFKLLIRDGDIVSPRIPFSEPLRNQVADFIECVSSNRKPVSDAATGTLVVQTLKAIDASIREQGRAVEVGRCRVASQSS
ncbi:MAG TPA: Gfo/Idh/MocA family oxidoreductase [Verrucomicrobiae bacterium]|nr:Gfo/Idh/MocA family oxidoreductase [Verrucomicrobiae bacterium]